MHDGRGVDVRTSSRPGTNLEMMYVVVSLDSHTHRTSGQICQAESGAPTGESRVSSARGLETTKRCVPHASQVKSIKAQPESQKLASI
jgi:hypothetical protein